MASEGDANGVRARLHALVATHPQEVLTRRDLGALNFGAFKKDLEEAIALGNMLLTLALEPMPTPVLHNLAASIDKLLNALPRMTSFLIAQNNANLLLAGASM